MNGQKSSLWRLVIPISCAALVLLLLFTNLGHAQVSGLIVQIMSAPSSATAGDTINVVVKISKPQGQAIEGYLKSYITAKAEAAGGFSGSEQYAGYVALNEEGWGYQKPSNKIYVSMDENDTEITRTLTNKIMGDCPTVSEASLKARLTVGGIDYDDTSAIYILAAPPPGVELPTSIKIVVAMAVVLGILAAAIFLLKRPAGEISTTEYPI